MSTKEYMKKWRENNKEKMKSYRDKYRNDPKNKQKEKETKRIYRRTHREEIKNKTKEYRRLHKRKYYSPTPKTQERKFRCRQYRYTVRGAKSEYFSYAQWKTLCQFYGNICLCCKRLTVLEVDHVIPLKKMGRNILSNVQPLCVYCNRRKGDKETDYRPDNGEFSKILESYSK